MVNGIRISHGYKSTIELKAAEELRGLAINKVSIDLAPWHCPKVNMPEYIYGTPL
jgi:hypothetical protein